jgi:hypothetical protein
MEDVGIFSGHLVYIFAIIYGNFGIFCDNLIHVLYQEKFGNPDPYFEGSIFIFVYFFCRRPFAEDPRPKSTIGSYDNCLSEKVKIASTYVCTYVIITL